MFIPNSYHCVQLKRDSYNSSQLQMWQERHSNICDSVGKNAFTLF